MENDVDLDYKIRWRYEMCIQQFKNAFFGQWYGEYYSSSREIKKKSLGLGWTKELWKKVALTFVRKSIKYNEMCMVYCVLLFHSTILTMSLFFSSILINAVQRFFPLCSSSTVFCHQYREIFHIFSLFQLPAYA